MSNLKRLLNETSKARRHRRKNLNIQITILGWSVEFIGFLMAFIGSFVVGHEDSVTTLWLQTLTLTIYFIVLPSTILLNGSKLKDKIVDNDFYISISNLFPKNQARNINAENMEQSSAVEHLNDNIDDHNGHSTDQVKDSIN